MYLGRELIPWDGGGSDFTRPGCSSASSHTGKLNQDIALHTPDTAGVG